MEKILSVALISMWFGIAMADVGEMPKVTEPYAWHLPFFILVNFAVPAILAYQAGRKDEREKGE